MQLLGASTAGGMGRAETWCGLEQRSVGCGHGVAVGSGAVMQWWWTQFPRGGRGRRHGII